MPAARTSLFIVIAGIVAGSAWTGRAQERPPQAAVDELLAVDRAFSAKSATTDVASGLSAMFAPDVIMPAPPGRFVEGSDKVADALKSNPDNAGATIVWTPIRGGVSADGQHGFTFGFMTLRKADTSVMPLKYLSYWVKRPEGWRVVAYKRGRAAGAAGSPLSMDPALPARLVPPSTDAAALVAIRRSLDDAERAFSRDAQAIGLGRAFAQYGSGAAVNMGGPNEAGFVVGSEAIGKAVSRGEPAKGSSVSWAPDTVIVASSGDLGVSIGMIRLNTPPSDPKQPSAFPFFTIWRRANASAPWRYIAE